MRTRAPERRGESGSRPCALVRAVAGALALALLANGCSTMTSLPVAAVPAEGLKNARVVLKDGYTYRFARLRLVDQELLGTYFVVEERTAADGTLTFVDAERETRVPVEQVSEIRVGKRDYGKTILLAAGGVIFGVWLAGTLDTDDDSETDSGGKPPQ